MGRRSFLILWTSFLPYLANAAQLPIDGLGAITGYSLSVYRAFQYRPICGTLDASGGLGQLPQQVTAVCNPALTQYRSIPETFALYDLSGVRLPDTFPITTGTGVCMCFSLSEVDGGTGKRADLCPWVSATGAENVLGTCAGLGCPVAAGSYAIGTKSLPKCFGIDIASVTGSLGALGTQTVAQIIVPSTSTSSVPPNTTPPKGPSSPGSITGTQTSNSPTSSNPSSGGSSSSGSSTPGGPAAVGIWMPIIFSFVVAAFTIYYKRKHYQLAKQKAEIEKLKKELEEGKRRELDV